AILCKSVQVRANVAIYEGAVVGDESILKDRCQVKSNIKIWPGKQVENGTILRDSLIWGTRSTKTYFGLDGFPGMINRELTPELAAKLGAAFGSCFGTGSKITLSTDNWPATSMLQAGMCAGLLSTGIQVLDLGNAITPQSRYMVPTLQAQGGVHIKRVDGQGEKVRINFFNSQGGNISKAEERKMENLLAREDIRRVEGSKVKPVTTIPKAGEQYLNFLMSQIDIHAFRQRPPKLVSTSLPSGLSGLVPELLERLGCQVSYLNYELSPDKGTLDSKGSLESKRSQESKGSLGSLIAAVREQGADLGITIDGAGESLILVDEQGNVLNDEALSALIALIILRTMPEGKVFVPVTASRAIEELAGRYQAQVVRTKTSLHSIMEYCLQGGVDNNSYGQFLMNFDALFALGKILGYLAQEDLPLSKVITEIPQFYQSKKAVECPWEAKGKVIRRLIEAHRDDRVELLDGIKVFYDEGWTLVLPDLEEPLCRIYGEGLSMEIAESLTDKVVEQIAGIVDL
ncbi:MAG: phosphohexomutase domain-containing protein, partial [Carboxydocellales bacterium]